MNAIRIITLSVSFYMISMTTYSCSNHNSSNNAETTESDTIVAVPDSFKNDAFDFEIQLTNNIATIYKDHSFAVSPISAQIAISMTANLVQDTLAAFIAEKLGYNNINELNTANRNIITLLTPEVDEHWYVPTKFTNKIWTNRRFDSKIRKNLEAFYGVKTEKTNLASKNVIKKITSSIAKASNNAIADPSLSLPPQTDIIISSIISYFSQWYMDYHFEDADNEIFYTPAGERKTKFMTETINVGYYANDRIESVTLKLDDKCRFICILPQDKNISSLFPNFSKSDLEQVLTETESKPIDLTLPEFTLNTDLSLIPSFDQLGIKLSDHNIFSEQFSNLKIDQEGITASSATINYVVVGCEVINDPIKVVFDRPFIFFLIEPESRTLLMAGQYVGPE